VTVAVDPNAVIRRFGHDIGTWVRREKRVGMVSPLYDLPGRSFLGFATIRDVAPDLVERLDAVIAPEELGRRMQSVLGRPYVLQGIMVMEGLLMAREQQVLDLGRASLDSDDDERTARVVSWFARVFSAYRADGELFAGDAVATQPVIAPAAVERWLRNAAPEGVDPVRVQRAFGALELYALTLHGEQRDGHFDHGPYALPDGRWATLHEINDLCCDTLPWSTEDVRLPVDAVGAVRAYGADVRPRFELFGTMATEPAAAPYETTALWARVGDDVSPLGIDELEALAALATQATTVLFTSYASWDDDFKTGYGAPLFANHLLPFARLAGLEGVEGWVAERAAAVTQRELPRLRGGDPLPVWRTLVEGDEDMFTPIGARA